MGGQVGDTPNPNVGYAIGAVFGFLWGYVWYNMVLPSITFGLRDGTQVRTNIPVNQQDAILNALQQRQLGHQPSRQPIKTWLGKTKGGDDGKATIQKLNLYDEYLELTMETINGKCCTCCNGYDSYTVNLRDIDYIRCTLQPQWQILVTTIIVTSIIFNILIAGDTKDNAPVVAFAVFFIGFMLYLCLRKGFIEVGVKPAEGSPRENAQYGQSDMRPTGNTLFFLPFRPSMDETAADIVHVIRDQQKQRAPV